MKRGLAILTVLFFLTTGLCCAEPLTKEEAEDLRNDVSHVIAEARRLDSYLQALTWTEVRGADVTDSMREEWTVNVGDSYDELTELFGVLTELVDEYLGRE